MNAKQARKLRRLAEFEMAPDKAPARDLVMGTTSVINSPQSVRAMNRALKAAYLASTRKA